MGLGGLSPSGMLSESQASFIQSHSILYSVSGHPANLLTFYNIPRYNTLEGAAATLASQRNVSQIR